MCALTKFWSTARLLSGNTYHSIQFTDHQIIPNYFHISDNKVVPLTWIFYTKILIVRIFRYPQCKWRPTLPLCKFDWNLEVMLCTRLPLTGTCMDAYQKYRLFGFLKGLDSLNTNVAGMMKHYIKYCYMTPAPLPCLCIRSQCCLTAQKMWWRTPFSTGAT